MKFILGYLTGGVLCSIVLLNYFEKRFNYDICT